MTDKEESKPGKKGAEPQPVVNPVEMADEAAGRDPRRFEYGYLAHDSAPSMANEGPYLWFKTLEQMKEHLASIESAMALYIEELPPSGEDAVDYLQVSDALRAILSGVQSAADFTPEVLEAISEQLGTVTMVWAGIFDDLCTGDSEWAQEARASYREAVGDETDDESAEPGDAPIEKDERDDFAEFVMPCED